MTESLLVRPTGDERSRCYSRTRLQKTGSDGRSPQFLAATEYTRCAS